MWSFRHKKEVNWLLKNLRDREENCFEHNSFVVLLPLEAELLVFCLKGWVTESKQKMRGIKKRIDKMLKETHTHKIQLQWYKEEEIKHIVRQYEDRLAPIKSGRRDLYSYRQKSDGSHWLTIKCPVWQFVEISDILQAPIITKEVTIAFLDLLADLQNPFSAEPSFTYMLEEFSELKGNAYRTGRDQVCVEARIERDVNAFV